MSTGVLARSAATVWGVSETSERYTVIAAGFGDRLAGVVAADAWTEMTPSDGMNVRELVNHVVDAHRRVAANVRREQAVSPRPDEDLVVAWQAANVAVQAALDDPVVADSPVSGPFDGWTFERLISCLVAPDLLAHTWDIAQATGTDDRLDGDAVHGSILALEPVDADVRRHGGFPAHTTPPADADEQTRFLCYVGRPA